jgi:hypothetical protein
MIALTCLLVVGAAAASILGRDSVPSAWSGMSASLAPASGTPVSNRETKKDKLVSGRLALASFEPQQPAFPAPIQDQAPPANAGDQLRMAFASTAPADLESPKLAAPNAAAAPKPKLVAKPPQPPVQKSYALLSDVQIAGIKERLKLSADQESYWPAVESALRAIARKIHATRKADPNAAGAPIDPDAAEVQQLKSAAMPLLFQLREDQKREVRSLARIIGLERVASMI